LMVILLVNSTNSIAIPLDSGYYPTSIEPEDWVWSNIEIVSSESTADSYYPEMGIDSSNNIHVVWHDSTNINGSGTDLDIFYKKLDSSTNTWGSTVVISTESTVYSQNPRIELDSSNNIHVVWQDSTNINGSGTDLDIFYKKLDSSTNTWGSTVVISTESGGNSQYPDISIDRFDNLHIVWQDSTNINSAGTDFDIFYKILNSTTSSLSDLIIISSNSDGNSINPNLKIDGQNNVHIVWGDESPIFDGSIDYDIVYRKFDTITSYWYPVQLLSEFSTVSAHKPTLAIDNLDNLHVAWVDKTPISLSGNDADVFYRRYTAFTSSWSAQSILSTDSDRDVQYITFGVDELNNVYCVWTDDFSGANNLVYKRYNYEFGVWSQKKYISLESGALTSAASISIDRFGFAHVIWDDNFAFPYSSRNIFYRSYSGLPTKPYINYINPNPTDDSIGITWDPSLGASTYNIYRSTDPIYDLTGLSPHATTESLYYVDQFDESGFYYYVITGVNYLGEGEISNMVYVDANVPADPITIIISDNQTITIDNLQTLTEFTAEDVSFPSIWIVGLFITVAVLRRKHRIN
ncbi:MAG: BNR repeat-containing protein, partial [Candidatus Heimdallarchaeota archaeon]|nr:BNR repeat-containing protein [Candidatus Heimdallarchaeota archaeon]